MERLLLAHLKTFVSKDHRARPYAFRCDVQSIFEPYGFPILVERSKYFDKGTCALLKGLELRCTAENGGRKCPFSITISGSVDNTGGCCCCYTKMDDGGHPRETDQVVSTTMTVHCIDHSHESNPGPERRYLPAQAWEEDVLRMVLDDKINITEAKKWVNRRYTLPMDVAAIRRRVNHYRDKNFPAEDECHRLQDNLEQQLQRAGRIHFDILHRHPGRTLAGYWFTCPQWLQEYYQSGVASGVCSDAKVVANNYNLPFFTICGREHDGHARI